MNFFGIVSFTTIENRSFNSLGEAVSRQVRIEVFIYRAYYNILFNYCFHSVAVAPTRFSMDQQAKIQVSQRLDCKTNRKINYSNYDKCTKRQCARKNQFMQRRRGRIKQSLCFQFLRTFIYYRTTFRRNRQSIVVFVLTINSNTISARHIQFDTGKENGLTIDGSIRGRQQWFKRNGLCKRCGREQRITPTR